MSFPWPEGMILLECRVFRSLSFTFVDVLKTWIMFCFLFGILLPSKKWSERSLIEPEVAVRILSVFFPLPTKFITHKTSHNLVSILFWRKRLKDNLSIFLFTLIHSLLHQYIYREKESFLKSHWRAM